MLESLALYEEYCTLVEIRITYYRNYNLKLHSHVLFDELYLRIRSLAFHCGSVVLCHAMQNVFAKAIRKFMTQILLYFLLNTIIE